MFETFVTLNIVRKYSVQYTKMVIVCFAFGDVSRGLGNQKSVASKHYLTYKVALLVWTSKNVKGAFKANKFRILVDLPQTNLNE